MVVTLDEFMEDLTPVERAEVAARTAELIEEELRAQLANETGDSAGLPTLIPGSKASG